jgi:lipoprotein-releasing system permease protein
VAVLVVVLVAASRSSRAFLQQRQLRQLNKSLARDLVLWHTRPGMNLSRLFFQRYLFSKRSGSLVKRIAWLCIFGISISLAGFLLILSVMNGLNLNSHERILAAAPHLTIKFAKPLSDKMIAQHEVTQYLENKKTNDSRFDFQLFDSQDVILRTIDGVFRGGIAKGMTEKSFNQMISKLSELAKKNNVEALSEDVLTSNGLAASNALAAPRGDEVLLGAELARALNVFEGDFLTVLAPESLLLPPGETPPFARVRVKKIISTNTAEVDAQVMFFSRGENMLNFIRTGSHKVGYEVWTKDPYSLSKYESEISKISDVQVESWQEQNSALFSALRLEKLTIGSFLGLSALITGASIWSVLTLLITQKIREIGLLMSFGLSSKRLMELFFQIGVWLAGIGISVGVVVGLGLALYIQFFPPQVLPDIYYDSQIPAQVDFLFVTLTILLSGSLCVFAVRLAVLRVLKLKPSEALRI